LSYLIDTSTLAELLRASPPQTLVRRLSQVPTRDRWTSVITVSQLLLAARQNDDARLMQNMIRLVAAIRVAAYDLSAAQVFAKFRSGVASDCQTDDVMIASIASAHDYTLVTRRPSIFERYKLRLEDWTSE
jgi:tRNA(fMet)-specific endonuclease VapC